MLSILAGKEKLAQRPSYADILRGFIGGTCSIFVLLLLGQLSGSVFIMAPFGASCVLLYAASQSPLAQPRNIIFGHFASALVGLIFLKVCGAHPWSIALSVGTAIAVMQWGRCVHPPAGANPLVILLTAHTVQYHWSFLIFPVLLGSLSLVGIAWCVNNVRAKQKWPSYGLALVAEK